MLDVGGSQGRQTNRLDVREWNGFVPEGSFYRLGNNVCIESLGFMFLRAASMLDFPLLVAFGDELCGRYSFDATEERGFRKRTVPLATKESLGAFLSQSRGCRGRERALAALRHVVDGSASPMETFDEMTMCLPYRCGGYGLPQPAMNACIELSDKAAHIAKRGKCYLDMAYIEFWRDVEHHGKYDHSSEAEIAADRARVNALREMGFEVIELDAEQVGDLFTYEYIIGSIVKAVGKRIRKEACGATPERIVLRRALYDWNQSSGRIC